MKKVLSLATAGLLVLGSANVLASPIELDTIGEIEFIIAEEESGPVIVPDGEDPIIIPDEDANYTAGPLRITHAPNLHFGQQYVTTANMTYYASATFGTVNGEASHFPLFAQATDLRGTFDGWTLNLRQDDYFVSGTTNHELVGAQIEFFGGRHFTSTPVGNEATHMVVRDSFILEQGVQFDILGALDEGGAGHHQIIWGTDADITTADDGREVTSAVQLHVPGNLARAETYTTTLTWSLSNTVPNI